jgi:glutamyl-Q tRNA(Asp) synthetase
MVTCGSRLCSMEDDMRGLYTCAVASTPIYRDHYRGRFAPSPTGPLHAGSLVAALASWLHARKHGGAWLVRMEDVDTPRCKREWGEQILQQLECLGLVSDEPVLWQSTRSAAYENAIQSLRSKGLVYACTCTRARLQALRMSARHEELIYDGECRNKDHAGGALRIRTDGAFAMNHNIEQSVGDFVLKRADGCYSYQLAVVVDDAAQGITHVVRGADLLSNTPRQVWLQTQLDLPALQYTHTPLVLAADGEKLSKQNGAAPLKLSTREERAATLRAALARLGYSVSVAANSADAMLKEVLEAPLFEVSRLTT